ncbi:MAG: TetR/AcrR family transcriptional regulator [Actinomycetota bacterium]|nr:TetR/AcrR family transcriptional regulator [Actinomycetota bacterium]
MLKATAQTPGPPPRRARSETKQKIIEAALDTLKNSGYRGSTAREISRRGGFNQALIFYHFGSITDLLLAALDETSARRMEAYETAVAGANTVEELIEVASRIYREDLASGHITVLSEMIAGSLSDPELGSEIVARLDPWIDFARLAIEKVLPDALRSLASSEEIAYAVVAFYLGIDLLTHLQPGRHEPGKLLDAAERTAPLLGALAGSR